MRPTECKWCGAEMQIESPETIVEFDCGSWYHVSSGVWNRDTECLEKCDNRYEQLRDRIRRALEKIKSGKRWSVEKIAKTPLEYYVDPDGWIAQASDVDEVARILEGDDEH